MLSLQLAAGNAAVSTALRPAPSVQRQPQKPPKWVSDAQAELGTMFPQDKLLGNVVIKDYADLNATLQTAPFAAWTQSKTEIFVRDLSSQADPKNPKTAAWPALTLRYVLRHEAEHVRQFDQRGGPPSTWLAMLELEREAYTNDLAWLGGAEGKRLVPDAKLRENLRKGVQKNLSDIKGLISSTAKLKGQPREAKLRAGMIGKDLIPSGAPADPQALYQQGP